MNFVSPAESLVGETLNDGWVVESRIQAAPNSTATGGFFSVGYRVRNAKGKIAFLKAVDLAKVAQISANAVSAQRDMLDTFIFERDILERCQKRNLDRIVVAIGSGELVLPQNPGIIVPYLIFEMADGDVRKHLQTSAAFDIAFILRCIHQVATGLQQLHSLGIAHQDVKPSNVLIFAQKDSKLCDLGRSVAQGFTPPHHNLDIVGDLSYAPPELLYGQVDPEWKRHRFACDIYHLGSLLMFFFVSTAMTPLLAAELDPTHTWPTSQILPFGQTGWTGTYAEVLPYVRTAFDKAMQQFEASLVAFPLDEPTRKKLITLTRSLCEPDPALRGHPQTRKEGVGSPFSLQRYVAEFNLLAKNAEVGILRW